MVINGKIALPTSSALHDAATAGDSAAIIRMLQAGVNPNARMAMLSYDTGITPLHLAARKGHLEATLALLKGGAGPNGGWRELFGGDVESGTGDWHYWRGRKCRCDPSPLHEAAAHGHVEIVRTLLAMGARRNARTSMAKCSFIQRGLTTEDLAHPLGGYTPLHLAARFGHTETVSALAEGGANVNILGGTLDLAPLHLATRHGHIGAMMALLKKRADVNVGDCDHKTALYEATSVPSLELLLDAGADINGRATHCAQHAVTDTPLGVLCTRTRVRANDSDVDIERVMSLVAILIRRGADTGFTAHCPRGELHTTSSVLTYPSMSRASTSDSSGSTTSTRGSTELDAYSSSLVCSSTTYSPLMGSPSDTEAPLCRAEGASSRTEDTSPSKGWINSPSSLNSAEYWGPTSLLSCAARNGVPGIVSTLLSTGLMDPEERDIHSMTPLHHASREGHVEVVRLLMSAGAKADEDPPTLTRPSPLHLACLYTRLDCVLELLRWGANLNVVCVLADTCFDHSNITSISSGGRPLTPLQIVGLGRRLMNPEMCKNKVIIPNLGDDGIEQECEDTGAIARNAIRRALQREDRWRRRRGVIILKALLSKSMDSGPIATAPSPSPSTGDMNDATTEDYAGTSDGLRISSSNSVHDDGGGCVRPRESEAAGVEGQVPGDSKRRAAAPSAEETRDESEALLYALAGLVDFAWGQERLFRLIVMHL